MFTRKIVKRASDLRKPCEKVSTEEGFKIIDQLEASLALEKGIGLAANQIGLNKRVCIIRVPRNINGTSEVFGHNFINPIVTERSDPILFNDEGCLSFPGTFIKTVRYNKVTVVDALEPNGRKFTGLEAVCAQHEIDHTLGKIMHESTPVAIGDKGACPCESGKEFGECCKLILKKKGLL